MKLSNIPHYLKRTSSVIKNRGLDGFAKSVIAKLNRKYNGYENISPQIIIKEPQQESFYVNGELVIISGVPFDDIGGGQRAAQLARCALKAGRKVIYLYIYKKYDFEKNIHVDSEVAIHGLQHLYIEHYKPQDILKEISSQATLIIEHPHKAALPFMEVFNKRGIKTVFELIDDWETSLGGDWFTLETYHRFVNESSVVVGTAKILVQRLNELGRKDAIYLPNAANEYIFDKYKKYSKPFDFPTKYKRVGLYFGSLYGEWFAWDHIRVAASENPDTAFILIGDRPEDKNLGENVIFLGSKEITDLPAYLYHSDFCVLPFIPGKISDAVSPIKVFEYLFLGKPVVSTYLPEIVDYPGVYVANNEQQFAKLCAEVSITDEFIQGNDLFISENSWLSRLDKLIADSSFSRFNKKVSVVILIHNNASIIVRNLKTLIQHCDYYIKEIIVIDNESKDNGVELVTTHFPEVKVIKNTVNGCSSGRNLGASHATSEYLAFFDSDQWFTSSAGFVEALTLLERNANIGIIGWGAGWFDPSRTDLGGMISDYCPNRGMNAQALIQGYRSDIGYLGTCGVFMNRNVFNSLSGFDTYYDPTCFEDTDLCFQIKEIGLDVSYRDLSGIRHQPHQTTKADSGSTFYAELFKRNSDYFKNKWSAHPEFYIDYKG